MSYSVKECFLTLQGEGAQSGRAAVFCRFIGCNLWSGTEKTRSSAICTFCDTDFRLPYAEGGGSFRTEEALATHIDSMWPSEVTHGKYVVFTGGEPMLQLTEALVRACHARGFEVAIETNGTLSVPSIVDWICVSPKANAPLVQTTGQELKLVYPQELAHPDDFVHLDFEHFFLQPMDCAQQNENTALAVQYCQQHPSWRLSVQTHKWIGIQ